MSHRLSTTAQPWCLIALAALVCWAAAQADDQGSKKGRSRLLMLVHVKADEKNPPVSSDRLQKTMEDGIKQSGCNCDSIRILPISERDYRNIRDLTSGLLVQPEVIDDREPLMRQLQVVGKEAQLEWEFRLPRSTKEKNQFPAELTVDFTQGPPLALKLGKGTDPKANFFPKDGDYRVRLPANRTPKSYTAKLVTLGKPGSEPLQRAWPAEQHFYYVIVLNNFSEGSGNREALINTVKDSNKVSNPLTDVELGEEYTFLFAAMNADVGRTKEGFDGNEYVVHIPALERRGTRRVWILFPITKAHAVSELARWQGYGLKELPQKILASNPIRGSDKVEITPKMPPTWIELPPVDAGRTAFSRRLKLTDIKGIQSSFPEVRRLVIWDFAEGESLPDPIEVLDPANNRRVSVLEQEMRQWPEGILKLSRQGK